MEIITTIIFNILISISGYLGIASTLVIVDGKNNENKEISLGFDELVNDYSDIPVLKKYKTRDHMELDYRYYPADNDIVLILLHGSGWHSKYFYNLASEISGNNLAKVYTPDLRGHGSNPQRRGDIDYINQYEDDINDFIKYIKTDHPGTKIILGGHSSGGGLALRYAGCKYNQDINALLLLSPFLKYNSPTMREDSGGWVSTHMPRIIGLSMLNNIGIRVFNHLKVIDFNMPKDFRDGTETLSYSFRLNQGYAPRDYKKDLGNITFPLILLAGKNDESFIADQFESEVIKYKNDAIIKVIDNTTHMGIVINKNSIDEIKKYISLLDEKI